MKVDSVNVPKETKRFEPVQTENLLTYKIYLVSNEQVIIHLQVRGRNY
jgi:hypothetical protein